MKNPGIVVLDDVEQQQECQKNHLHRPQNNEVKARTDPDRTFYLWILTYIIGVVAGTLLYSLGQDEQFWRLFIQIYQSDLIDKPFNQLLKNQLALQITQLLFAAFLGHCVLGGPLLWLCCIGKAAVHTSVICSMLIEQQVSFMDLILCYLLFEFGCSAVYFFVLSLAKRQCGKMFHTYVKNKNQPAAFPVFWEKLLVMVLVSICWCLICSGVYYCVNQS